MQTHGGLLPDLAGTEGVIGETGHGGPAGHNMAYAPSAKPLKHTALAEVTAPSLLQQQQLQ